MILRISRLLNIKNPPDIPFFEFSGGLSPKDQNKQSLTACHQQNHISNMLICSYFSGNSCR